MPSRQFKENFVVGGCFTLSMLFIILLLASFHLWYFLPVFLLGWIFVIIQSVRMGIWKKREDRHEK